MKAKEIDGLDCAGGAAAGAKLVLRTRLEEMCALGAAALNWDDIEGVHDMRVASRRLRSVVRDFDSYFRKDELSAMRDEVKRLADALGDVRDEDVAIAGLEKLCEAAPPEVCDGIRKLTDERRRRREDARAKLSALINEGALSKFERKCLAAIEKARARRRVKDGDRGRESAVAASFRQSGRDIISGGWRELKERSASLSRPHKTKPLHKMRITAKRLRYAIELFTQCWGEPLRPFAKELAKLQSSLGELHDCDVWIEDLGEQLRARHDATRSRDATNDAHEASAASSSDESLQAQRAAVWLMRHFTMQRTESFHAALTRWHEWEAENFERRLYDELANNFPPPTLSTQP